MLYSLQFLRRNEDITSDMPCTLMHASVLLLQCYKQYQAGLLLVCYSLLKISEENEDITSDMPRACLPPSML